MFHELWSLVFQAGATGWFEISKLQAEPQDPNSKSDHQTPEGPRFVGSLPEEAEQEDCSHLGREKVGDCLQSEYLIQYSATATYIARLNKICKSKLFSLCRILTRRLH